MVSNQLSYLAGLIDGDGSIFVSKRNEQSGYKHGRYRLFLGISNQNRNLLKHLANTWKRGIVYWQAKNYKAGRITWEGPKAKSLLAYLLPYLVGKKAQAMLAMKFPCVGKGN